MLAQSRDIKKIKKLKYKNFINFCSNVKSWPIFWLLQSEVALLERY